MNLRLDVLPAALSLSYSIYMYIYIQAVEEEEWM